MKLFKRLKRKVHNWLLSVDEFISFDPEEREKEVRQVMDKTIMNQITGYRPEPPKGEYKESMIDAVCITVGTVLCFLALALLWILVSKFL